MATNVTINSNYKGSVQASPIIFQMLAETDAIEKGLFTEIYKIEGSTYVRKIEGTTGLQDYRCGWFPNGSVVLSEVELAPKKLMLQEDFCKEDFRGNNWDSASAGPSAWSNGLPTVTKEAVISFTLDRVSTEIDRVLFYGEKENDGEFDGLITNLLDPATSGATIIAGTTITAANVIAELGKVVDAIPANLYGKEDTVILISQNIARAYTRAQNTLGFKELFFNNAEIPTIFDGVRLEMVNALEPNTMIAYQVSNVFFGSSLQSDLNELRIKDMDDTDLSGEVRVKMVFTGDVAVAFPSEVVLYQA